MKRQKQDGFSLIECLISLTIFLLVILTSMEFLISARRHYSKLKEDQERQHAAVSAMDKIKSDIAEAGRGLIIPIGLGVIQGLYEESESLIILSAAYPLVINEDLVEGQSRISNTMMHPKSGNMGIGRASVRQEPQKVPCTS